jgi:hypothetical protein
MARLYTEVEVRRLIEEATAPLLARIAPRAAMASDCWRRSNDSFVCGTRGVSCDRIAGNSRQTVPSAKCSRWLSVRPGVEPTNNAMEQRFRFVVIDRTITQEMRGQAGRSWCERIWTVLATCAQRGRFAFLFLEETMDAFFAGRTLPTLEFNSS